MAVCRYCGKTLPLLERFAGPGAFCSREHRQRYQDEYSRLALKRLLGEEEGEPDATPLSRPAAVPVRTAAVAAAVSDVATLHPPRVAPAIPASPDMVAVRRGGRPRLPALEWVWRVELAEPEAPADPQPETTAAADAADAPAPVAAVAVVAPAPVAVPHPAAPETPPVTTVAAAPQPVVEPEPPPAEEPRGAGPAESQAPEFATAVGASFWSRIPLAARIGLLAVTVALIGVATQRFIGGGFVARPTTEQSAAARAVAMGPGGWFNRDMPDRNGRKTSAGTFSVYKPSLELSDYRVEFDGQIEQSSLGWFVRFTDPDNYQAMKLIRQAGRHKLVRWLVRDGEITAREELALPPAAASLKGFAVRTEVRGPRYTVQVNGQQIDAWTDDRLRRGGFGFLNEGDERGRAESVQLFLLGN